MSEVQGIMKQKEVIVLVSRKTKTLKKFDVEQSL